MNDTTFSGNGKVSYIPVITGANPKPITNADRIRAMTEEELAEFIVKIKYPYRSDGKDYEIALNWLKSPVEVDE